MDKLIFTVLNGMKVSEMRQANTFNELANVNTTGFKSSFNSVAVAKDLTSPDAFDSRAFPSLRYGNTVNLKPGPMIATKNDLDVYISNKGVLAVQAKDGSEAYTRRGDLKVTENGVLTTGAGHVVLGNQGPITLPPSSKVTINQTGVISVIPMSSTDNTFQEIDRLKLVNSEGQELKIREDGLYETESKQPLPEDGAIGVMVGALEGSSAKPVELMVQMIKDSRDYEMQVRVIKNAKEISTSSASMIRMDS